MGHSDVSFEHGTIDILSEEMCLHRSVAISAVVAIKDFDDDRTSTAIGNKADPWVGAKRYVRLRDYERLPVTFGEDDVCDESGDEELLINTGCMLIDLSHEFWKTFCFEVPTRMLNSEGELSPIFRPEDWEMSRALNRANLPYHATWRPITKHHGTHAWENRPRMQVISNGQGES